MKCLWILCALVAFGSSALAIDREAFTITRYDLDVRLEPEQHRLGARGKITLRNDSAVPQKIAVLQISSSLTWHLIRINDRDAQFVSKPYVSDIDHTGVLSEAIVTLPTAIKPQDSVEATISYEGTITQDATRLTQIGIPENIAEHSSWDQISPAFTAVRGAGYVAWYPIATTAADFSEGNSLFQVTDRWRARAANASMKLSFSLAGGASDSGVIALCDGGRVSTDARTGTPQLPSAMCEYSPLGTTTPTFVSGKLAWKTGAEGSDSPGFYVLAGREIGATAYLSAIAPATKFVTDWFGPPRAHVIIVDLADESAAPFESGNMLLTPFAAIDRKMVEINLVHMMAHSSLQSARPWIHEGLAHFAEAMYREQKQDGRADAIDFLNLHRTSFVEAEKELSASPQKNPGQPLATTFDESYYRSKAAYVWWMLRDMLGEDALKQVIRNYRAAGDKDFKYIEQLVAATTKRDLGWFFDDWVYHDRGLPDFRVLAVHSQKSAKDTQIVAVTIENLGAAGAEVPFTIRFGTGEVTRRIEVRAKSSATTRVEVPGAPTTVVVNDGSVPESDLTNNVFKIAEP